MTFYSPNLPISSTLAAGTHSYPLITLMAAAFTAAWVMGLITQRLRLSPIVGYLLAGVAIGPFTPGFVGDPSLAPQLAEIGVILLMFGVGLHFHLKDLLAVRTVAGHPDMPLGFADGTGTEARFRAQLGLAVTEDGTVFLSDTANYRVRKVVPGPTPADTEVWTIAGSGQLGTRLGHGEVADIVAPTGLTLTPDGKVLAVSDSSNNVVRIIVR